MTTLRALAAVSAALLLGACSHPLEVRNLGQYSSLARGEPLERQTTVGLITSAPDAETRRLLAGIGPALDRYAARVIHPYSPTGARAEVVARVTATPRYEGAGRNWFVNFPGLLVAAPAWHGYAYEVGYEIQVLLTRAWDNAKLDAWTVPVSLDVRHASGLLLAPDYNPEVTAPTVSEAGDVLADHVARDIVRRLNSEGRLWNLEPPADWAGAPSISTTPAPPPVAARPVPPVLAPPAPPASSAAAPAAPTAWAAGQTARLRAGARARVRMAPDADVAKGVDPGQPVTLKSRVKRDTGAWWYVATPAGSGWVLESDLQPAS